MIVPSFEFLAFATAVALVLGISAKPLWRRSVLVAANLGFILTFTHDPLQLAPFAMLLVLGFAGVKLMEAYKRQPAFAVLVVALLSAFCWLKNYSFVPHGLFLPFAYLTVGMSYVFFRVLHLVIDAYQESLPAPVGVFAYISYTLNFTSFLAGPIQFYKDYLRTESQQPAVLDEPSVGRALERIIVGFFKVAIVSPLLLLAHAACVAALSTDALFADRVLHAALVLAIFPFYLYANFSGYTDVVIGTARFLRLELPENFNHPFVSKSFIELWTRWHITLSLWLRTYVYSPLLLSLMRRFPSPRVEPWLGVLVYFITFFLIGVWHGQTAMFIALGLLLGLGVGANKIFQLSMTKALGRARYRSLCGNPVYSALSCGLTFAWLGFSLLWFWSTPGQLGGFARLLGPAEIALTFLLVVVLAAIVLTFGEKIRERLRVVAPLDSLRSPPYLRAAWCTTLAVIIVSVTVVLNAPAPHIVYRAF